MGLETLEEKAENNSPTHGVEKKKPPLLGRLSLTRRIAFLVSCLVIHLAF
jgi:hypothetical protein